MRIGFLALPLGLLELVLIAVVIILIVKAITGSKQAGKTIAAVLVAASLAVVVMVVFAGLALFGVRQAAVHESAQQQAVMMADQAQIEAQLAQERVHAMEEEVQAKVEEIEDRMSVDVDNHTAIPTPPVPPTPPAAPSISITQSTSPPGVHSMPSGHRAIGVANVSLISLIALSVLGLGFILLIAVMTVVIARHRGGTQAMGGAIAGGSVAVIALVVILGLLFGLIRSWQTSQSHASYADAVPLIVTEQVSGQEPHMAVHPSADEQVPEQSSGTLIAGTPWTTAVEEYQEFEADVYPSLEAAAEALGRRVGQSLNESSASDQDDTPSIYVWRDDESGSITAQDGGTIITRDVLEAVADGLRQKLIEPATVSVERPVSGVAVRVAIQEVNFENHNRWRQHTETRSGGLALRVTSTDGSFSVSTRFAEAPWVVDRTSFAKAYANGDWMVAYSDGAHTTHEDARRDALITAAEALLPLARARINHLSGSDQHQFNQQMAKNPNWLRDRVADELLYRNLATDQFTQQFERPYGPIWREAVLVNASPNRVEEIARSLVQGINMYESHQRNTWFSFIALGGLILGTYGFLNMATKGYYAWTLRAALVVGLALVGLLIMRMTYSP